MMKLQNKLVSDLMHAKKFSRFWLKLSWLEFYGWYGRLNLGLAWVVISPLLFSLAVSVVYAEVFNRSYAEHFLYVYSGYICWLYIADTLGPGSEVYNLSYSYYSETKLPLVGFNIKSTIVRTYSLLLNTVVFCFVALFYGEYVSIPILVLVFIYFFLVSSFLSIMLSIIFAYFADLKMIIQNIMRMLFFLTPIVWVPDSDISGIKAALVYANPCYYIVEAYRMIISGNWLVENLYAYGLIAFVPMSCAFLLYDKFSKKMVFICK